MRIKVTAYLNSEDLEPEEVDTEDATGLSAAGFERLDNRLRFDGFDDIEFKIEDGSL